MSSYIINTFYEKTVLLFVLFNLYLIPFTDAQLLLKNKICTSDEGVSGFVGKTYEEALDYSGKIHNDYQELSLSLSLIQIQDFTDTNSIKLALKTKNDSFFIAKGIPIDNATYDYGFAETPIYPSSEKGGLLSPEAKDISQQLEKLVKNRINIPDTDYYAELLKLKGQVLRLQNGKDFFTIGIPVYTALYSFDYWNTKAQSWGDTYLQKIPTSKISSANKTAPFKPNLSKLGGADVGGAVSGGYGGTVLGPGGAAAGAILGAAASSLGNLTNQVISHYVSWWPW